ncbi:MAG TPA: molybdopterin cofactor-binding domain-containing protein [Candidatus Binataceae bacterium]|nr:molybdopterin cofactor-binding domain-containing protein [Candidatus Binataceae bacterium]
MSQVQLPWSLRQNPRLGQWIDLSEPGIARVFTAKVELGQGILTALAQIAAEELRLPMAKVRVVSGDTRFSPDESYTAGSMSIEIGGSSLRMACAEAREALLRQAVRALDVDASRLSLGEGAILLDGQPCGLDYWTLAAGIDWELPVVGSASLTDPGDASYVGQNIARLDLPAKLLGGAFVQDFELPRMLHGRVLRPSSQYSHLAHVDLSVAQRLPGIVKVWRNRDFVGICCEREFQAIKALEALRANAHWTEDERLPAGENWTEWLLEQRSLDSQNEIGEPVTASPDLIRCSAWYSKPPLAHASIGPSCAIAHFSGGELRVWTQSQGVFPLRAALARALGLQPQRVIVIHVQGAGCYGHNGADDVALDAALLALQVPSRPVRVQWMRDDEFGWAPVGSPMAIRIKGAVSAAGKMVDWSTEIWSGPHGRRPNLFGVELLAATQIDPPIPFPNVHEDLNRFAGGARNCEPSYDLPHRKIVLHSLPDLPFRTSALRTLGGYANVFAAESFVDELGNAAKVDPVQFRLQNLSDPRARTVIETAARMSRWDKDASRGSGRAAGIAFCRYKTTAAYVGVVAQVEVSEQVRVTRVDCAVDAGLAINPDGVINQIEGGIVQSISWTLKERIAFGPSGTTARTWEDYPILGFDEVPEINIELISQPKLPPLGVGEAAHGPVGAAIANAVARALDCRIRDLPITRERIIEALNR